MSSQHTVVMVGPFTDDELIELGQMLLRFDEQAPDRVFAMTIAGNADQTEMGALRDIVARIFPPKAGRKTEIVVVPPPERTSTPGFWMHETSGVLRPAVEAYLSGSKLTDAHIGALRAYFRQWLDGPWQSPMIEPLRAAIDGITNRRSVEAWLDSAAIVGIDPL